MDPAKRDDNRWLHRSCFDWGKAELRHQTGTVEHRIFSALKKRIALRKEVSALADFDNRTLLVTNNPSLLVLVVENFNIAPQALPIDGLRAQGFFRRALTCCWLVDA